MQAIQTHSPGGPEQLYLGECPKPRPGPGELLVKVAATALNRADTLQRQGKYPPPKGESPILGLEMAGTVVEAGEPALRDRIGERVCGLLGGGGYAEYALIPDRMALPWPQGLDAAQAAAIPEVFLTAFQALSWLAKLRANERVLIHAGASGVGTAAIQLAKAMDARSFVTASAPKHELCLALGAEQAIDYRSEDFAERIKAYTDGHGADVIVDFIGGGYFQQNLDALAMDGRLVMLAFLGGVKVEQANLLPLLRKRLQVIGSTLRARSLAYKIELSQALQQFAWPLFESGQLRPVINKVYDWREVAEAHSYMESNQSQGKLVLRVGA